MYPNSNVRLNKLSKIEPPTLPRHQHSQIEHLILCSKDLINFDWIKLKKNKEQEPLIFSFIYVEIKKSSFNILGFRDIEHGLKNKHTHYSICSLERMCFKISKNIFRKCNIYIPCMTYITFEKFIFSRVELK